MNVNETKLNRQLLFIEKWKNSKLINGIANGFGVGIFPTGFGKTFTCCYIIINILKKFPNAPIIITFPNENLEQNWVKGLQEVQEYLNINIDLSSIQYLTPTKILNKDEILKCHLLVIDEFDAYYSDKRQLIIDGSKVERTFLLGITATPYDNLKKHFKILQNIPIIDEVTEKEAIENGWISNFVEFNYGIRLNEVEKYQYDFITGQYQKFLSKFGGDIDLAKNCLHGGEDKKGVYFHKDMWCYQYAKKMKWHENLILTNFNDKEINDIWNPKMISIYATNLFNAIRSRMKLIYNNESKLKVAFEIIKKFEDLKIISFSQSTEFADRLGEKINTYYKENVILNSDNTKLFNESIIEPCVIYHSNLEPRMLQSEKTGKLIKFGQKRLKDRAIDMIKTNKARIISTASALDKGFDVQDIKIALISSRTQSQTQRTQRGGRAKRIEEDLSSTHRVLIINLYLEDTQDEVWLKNSQKETSTEIYTINNIDELVPTPKKKKYLLTF